MFNRGSLDTIWTEESGGNGKAIVVAEENESVLGIFAMMELETLAKDKKIVTRRGQSLSSPLFDLLKSIKATQPFVVLSIEKGSEATPTIIFEGRLKDKNGM